MGGDHGRCRLRHVSASQKVRLQILRRDADAGLYEGDLLPHHHRVVHVPKLHADQIEDADLRPGQQALDVQPDEAEEQDQHEQEDEKRDPRDDEEPDVAGGEIFLRLGEEGG